MEAQNFHHKLQISLKAIIGCKTSYKTCQSHDYFQYERRAYHRIAAFNGVIETQLDGRLHWHIMLYSSVLSPKLLEKVAAATSKSLQSQIGTMLDSITCTTVQCDIHQWYNNILSSVKHGSKQPRGADIKVPDASSNYEDFISIGMKNQS